MRRGSDLKGMFVGETEVRIAEAFREAARASALLLIDEADDFLFDRRGASRSWEASMVNEMLRQMEALRTSSVATTNLVDRLDPACQRRFTIRVAFDTLPIDRVRQPFRAYFSQEWPSGQDVPLDLTPGDFGVISEKAGLLGEVEARTLDAKRLHHGV